jgi:hypothetical protein
MLIAGFRVNQRDRVQAGEPFDDQPAFVNPLPRPAAAVVSQHSRGSIAQAGQDDRPSRALASRQSQAVRKDVPGWRDRRVTLFTGGCFAEDPFRASTQISQKYLTVSETIGEICEGSKVARHGQIAERMGASRHPAQRATRDTAHCVQ